MSRRRKPDQLHKRDGTYRGDRHGGNHPSPAVVKSYLDPPTSFNKWAKEEWKRVVPTLVENGLLSTVDLGLFESAMEHYGVYREMVDQIYHTEITDENGKKKRVKRSISDYLQTRGAQLPEWRMVKESFQTYRDIMYKFGVTPVERTKIELPEKKSKSEMDELLENGGS